MLPFHFQNYARTKLIAHVTRAIPVPSKIWGQSSKWVESGTVTCCLLDNTTYITHHTMVTTYKLKLLTALFFYIIMT